MALHTQQSLSGFIASEPQQSITENGDTRFYLRVGQPHFRREDDGGFTELEPSFHDLVACRATAERAQDRFAKGNSFVAEGYVHTFQVERDGEVVEREEFVAKKIGHDLARTNRGRPCPARISCRPDGDLSPAMPERLFGREPDDSDASFDDDSFDDLEGPLIAEPPHPIKWNLAGEPSADAVEDVATSNRNEDFVEFVTKDVARRRLADAESYSRKENKHVKTEPV